MVQVDKLRNLMLAIAASSSVSNLGLTKLWKLIYFADVAALRAAGSTITDSEFVKYPHGPVPSRGEKHLKKLRREKLVDTKQGRIGPYTQTFVTAIGKPDMRVFSREERAIIERVCQELGAKTAKELSDMSHEESAWARADELEKLDSELMFYGNAEDPEGL